MAESDRAGTDVEAVWRPEVPSVLMALTRRYGNFADCEDAVQEALLAAATQWPRDGVPDDPRAWLIRVGARRLVDQVRSDAARRTREEREVRLVGPALDGGWRGTSGSTGDDTLELLVLCAHPALTRASQVALMLRAVVGLTTAEIASGFLVPATTMGQRISRAKATLAEAGASFPAPAAAERPTRLVAVRHALALLFTEGHARTSGDRLTDAGFTAEAVRLARALHAGAPEDTENAGLLALFLLTTARSAARTDDVGDLVPLAEQDRSRWDHAAIAEGVALLEEALPAGPVGQFQLQAAIAAVHGEARCAAQTDWPQIAELYRMLDAVAPSLAVGLGLAVATAEAEGAGAGLRLLDALDPSYLAERHHRFHAVRGHLLRSAGRTEEGNAALARAAQLTRSIPEQRYLNRLLATHLKG